MPSNTDSTATDTEDSTVGVVTAVETPSGSRISTTDITPDTRRDWCDAIKDALKEIEAVDEVYLAGLAGRNQSASFEITVDATPREHTNGVTIDANLRSVAQRLRNTVEDITVVSSYELMDSPTAIDAAANHYDSNLYVIDVWFY